MIDLMRNGGFPMYFILAFGLITLGAAARFALQPRKGALGFIRSMGLATLFSTLTGTCADLAAVFMHLSGNDEVRKMADWYWLLIRGLGESMSPGIVGFTLLSLAALLVAVGRSREGAAA